MVGGRGLQGRRFRDSLQRLQGLVADNAVRVEPLGGMAATLNSELNAEDVVGGVLVARRCHGLKCAEQILGGAFPVLESNQDPNGPFRSQCGIPPCYGT